MKSLNMPKVPIGIVASMKILALALTLLMVIPLVSAQVEIPPDMEVVTFEESFDRKRDVHWGYFSVFTTSYFYPTYLEEEVDEFGRKRKYIHTNCTGFSVNITESRWFNLSRDEIPYWSEGNILYLSVEMNAAYEGLTCAGITEGDFLGLGFNETLTREAVIDGDGIGFSINFFVYNSGLIHKSYIQFLVNFTISVYFISTYMWEYIMFGGCIDYEFFNAGVLAIIIVMAMMAPVVGIIVWYRKGRKNGTRKSESAIPDTGNNRIRADS